MVYFILFYAALGAIVILVVMRIIKNRKSSLAKGVEHWFEINPEEAQEKIKKAGRLYGRAFLHFAALYTIKGIRFVANKSRSFFRRKAHQVLSKLHDYETGDKNTPREMSSFMRDMHEHKRKINGDGIIKKEDK